MATIATPPSTTARAGDAYTAAQAAQDAQARHATRTFRVWRGERGEGKLVDYVTQVTEGMVVLDAIHQIQAEQATDLAVRWNCKAGKCGSCSAEIDGVPRLMCMTRLSELPGDAPVTVEPMRAFPPVRDLVTADRMLRKLRGQLAAGMALGPTRRAVLGQAAADAANRAMGNPADAALDRACERLLDELDSDAEQLLPFDTAASIVERATLQRRRSLRNSPPSDER